MDFNMKQWRYQQHESDSDQQQQHPSGYPPALPLFVPELTSKLSHLSAFSPDSTTATRFPKMGSYFSLGQWQELELQALIFRHMLAGASVPPQLLHPLKRTLLNTSPPPPPPPPQHYLHHPLQHYHPTALLQTGYWGRAAMDPEPGRCRRTDGKKWRCSRDVVAGHKYCERHMNRGRNRSRKPVEIPTPSTTSAGGGGGGGGGVIKTNTTFAAQPRTAMAGGTHFSLSGGPSPSMDLLHLNQRPSESKPENKLCLFETQNEVTGDGKSGGRVLRCFFDDWPRSLQEPGNAGSKASPVASSTCLSILTPSNNPPSSDFSLKLSTGNGDDRPGHLHQEGSIERERLLQLNWAAAAGWGTNHPVAPMGGPLAEALRSSSSTSNLSPKSVLHQLQRNSTSETTSYVST